MKIEVIGLGYIGFPTAMMFANSGNKVVGVDINQNIINTLNRGQTHITENGIDLALKRAIDKKLFKATTKVEPADVFIISVPTPNIDDMYKTCDLSYVEAALQDCLSVVEKGNIIIIESTIPPGTTNGMAKQMIQEFGFVIGKDIYLVHSPERVLPGKILQELQSNNRIMGGCTYKCAKKAKEIYETFVEGEIDITLAEVAEMSKLVENTYRDVNIALANELAKICHSLDINILDVIHFANKHPRVQVHSPGPGVGGHCLAVDPYFIISSNPKQSKLIQNAREVNNSMPTYIVDNVKKIMNKVDGRKITIAGVAYKGNIDDYRESPSLEIIKQLSEFFEITVHDPYVRLDSVSNNLKESLKDSDLLVILTDHNEYKKLTQYQLGSMRTLNVFDTKNIVEDLIDDVTYYSFSNLFTLK
ncbi:nucleotide sugar dehydrogenase [Enterococcus faecalis]|nr:nucleotide sugar dehydrogenase [Enterococcus faecalis]